MKYFGCIDENIFTNKSEKEIEDYLLKNKLFELKQTGKANIDNIKDGVLNIIVNVNEKKIEPCNELINDFYSFIINLFKYEIMEERLLFFKLFNDEIYGLDYDEQKRIALNHFNNIYKENYIDAITFFDEEISDNGIRHAKSHGKLKMLNGQLNAFKSNLINEVNEFQYLIGNMDYFNKDTLKSKYPIIEETIYFEIWLQILIEINDKYDFEEDLYFSQIRFDKATFEKYQHIFKSFESFQFTNNKIKSFKEDHKAHIESLHHVLLENDLIYYHKENFMKFLKEEYNLTITKIISYDKSINYKHDERVALFMLEWSNLTSEK